MDLNEAWPPYRLSIAAGDLQLRPIRDEDLPELAELALDGVHEPGQMPFAVPWTDAPREQLPANIARYHWSVRSAFGPERFSLEFGVRVGGELVGCQGFSTHDFAITRTGETGSWLARRHQGRGIGTRMRQALCTFAFDELNATQITSGAFLDNPASLAVSRKVGYRPNGVDRKVRRGVLAEHQNLILGPEDLIRGDPVEVTGAAELRRFLELEPPA
ncbi:MAG TPA: GNAT family protein [Mycobacteriales bacterium]|nr:GNAT family protein [Mycobacteriales bacterium]